MQLRDFSIGTRLSLGFGSILAILVAMVVMVNIFHANQTLVVSLGVAGVAIGVVMAYLITRSIVEPLHEAAQAARTVAAGELGAHIHAEGSDEIAELMRALRDMNENLAKAVAQVRSGT